MSITTIYRMLLVLLLAALSACGSDPPEPPPTPPDPPPPPPPAQYVRLMVSDGATYTQFDGERRTQWISSDRLGLFMEFGMGPIVGPERYDIVAPNGTNEAEFRGALTWQAPGRDHTFFAYYPYNSAATNVNQIPVTLPSVQIQHGQEPDHIGPLDFLYGQTRVVSPAAGAPEKMVGVVVSHLFALVEFRISIAESFGQAAFLNGVQLSSVMATTSPLGVSDARFDLQRDYSGGDFSNTLTGGTPHDYVRVDVDPLSGNPASVQLPLTSSGDHFTAWMLVLPGEHRTPVGVHNAYPLRLDIELMNEAGEFSSFPFRYSDTTFYPGRKYVYQVDIDPTLTPPGWDGKPSLEPPRQTLSDTTIIWGGDGGSTVLTNPYHVHTPGELYWLSRYSHPDSTGYDPDILASGIIIYNDIHLSDSLWLPLGCQSDHPYTGQIVGYGEGGAPITISGLKVEGNWPAAGLLGYGGYGCYFRNFHVIGNVSTNAPGGEAGGLIGWSNGWGQGMYDVSFSGNVSASMVDGVAGGLVGDASAGSIELYDCDFTGGTVSANIAGGLIGRFNTGSLLGQSVNHGDITGTSLAGGVIGEYLAEGTISDAENHGTVIQNGAATGSAGGVVGRSTGAVNFVNCLNDNEAVVMATGAAGGIISSQYSGSMTDCINRGSVTSTNGNAGGLTGTATASPTLTRCVNYGNVTAYYSVGGIAGQYSGGGSTMTGLQNYGDITQSSTDVAGAAGGIFGRIDGWETTFTQMINRGNVSGFLSGGLFGSIDAGAMVIRQCVNHGNITGSFTNNDAGGAGGLVGRGQVGTMEDSYNSGRIEAYNLGGLITDVFTWGSTFNRLHNSGTLVSRGGACYQIYGRALTTDDRTPPYTPITGWNPVTVSDSFYRDQPGANTHAGAAVQAFSATAWPGATWQTTIWNRGSWNGGTPVYPSLVFEP